MKMILGILGSVIVLVIIFFMIPFSPSKKAFEKEIAELTKKEKETGELLTNKDIEGLPELVQEFFIKQGYIGKPKTNYVKVLCKDVTFVMDKKTLQMESEQYNFASEPTRIAFMESALFGIPFEGKDRYVDGKGSMKGVLAKLITLFNQTGENMDKACLATYLSEILFIPSAVLENNIVWEPVNDTQVKATITYKETEASGVFTFNNNGEFASFTTNDREMIDNSGKGKKVEWTAYVNDYKENKGIKSPTKVHATWHLEKGDLVYFKTDNFQLDYGY
jgi:hypothetical protein